MDIDILIPIHLIDFVFLEENLNSIKMQTFKNYNIIITDETNTDDMYNFIIDYSKKNNMNINYHKSLLKGWSNNHNNGLKHCKSALIKILHYDNYFYHENALNDIVEIFKNDENIYWVVSTYIHNKNNILCDLHTPKYNDNILKGINTIGDPSCLTFKNKNILSFDVNLTWFVDCDYYYRLYNLYSYPHVLNNTNIVVRHHKKQTTLLCENNIELHNFEKKHIELTHSVLL
jgi:hypothetical protein